MYNICMQLTNADPESESKSSSFYVPRDEAFAEVKQLTFSAKTVYSVLHAVVPSLETAIIDANLGFPYFTAIDSLFNEGINLPPLESHGVLKDMLPRLVKAFTDAGEGVLRFETPQTMDSMIPNVIYNLIIHIIYSSIF